MFTEESNEAVKKYIRVQITNLSSEKLDEGLNQGRNDGYESTVDWGYEDLDLREDAEKIQLYMSNDFLTLNNNKYYKVVKRIFQPNRPVMLCIDVEEINQKDM